MWLLIEVKEGNDLPDFAEQRLLYPGKTYSVGRRDSTITIEDDKSVSRKHANITVEDTNNEEGLQNVLNPSKRSSVILRDEGAKYGTFVNTSKISAHQPYVLRDNDLIKFGTLTSLWRLAWFPIVICCSGLRSSEKERIYRAALELDIKISKTWVSDICTHLYMKELRPTEKALLAIADLCPIISISWLDEIKENRDSTNFQFPAIERHQPPLNAVCEGVPEKPNFLPMPRRKTVFTDTTFYVFSEQQYHRMLPVVSKCGGDISYCKFGIKPWNTRESIEQLVAKDLGSILIYPPSGAQDDYDAYHTKYKILFTACSKLGERLVSEVEVGWAVVVGNTKLYCNKYGPDPIDATAEPDAESRLADSSIHETSGSPAVAQLSSFASDISTPVVKSRPPAPPSWVLGDITDVQFGNDERQMAASQSDIGISQRQDEPSGSSRGVPGPRNPQSRASKRSLMSVFDDMFDDLEDVTEKPQVLPVNTRTSNEKNLPATTSKRKRTEPIPEEPITTHAPEPSRSSNLTIGDHIVGETSPSVQPTQHTPRLADINSRTWDSSDEGEADVQIVVPASNSKPAHELATLHDEIMDANMNEKFIVNTIEKKQKSLKEAARKSREEAVEEDEAFVTDPSEKYSTVIVRNLVKAPTSASQRDAPTTNSNTINYKRFRKVSNQQNMNEMSYISMLPHDEIRAAFQGKLLITQAAISFFIFLCRSASESYWLEHERPQRREITRPGARGGDKLSFD